MAKRLQRVRYVKWRMSPGGACEFCRSLDGEVFRRDLAPYPAHPNCHCSLVDLPDRYEVVDEPN
jgi:hypothetical protein